MTPLSGRSRAWAELLRVSALVTVPGDALAGAAAAGRPPGRGTALAAGASLCLYEAGMALNDWADRDTDAVERPRRPLPSGRVAPGAALAAAGGLTAAGLALAAAAGRPALATAGALAGAVWAYDLKLKNTPAGPVAMAAARALDLLLGAAATATAPANARRAVRGALPPAALLGAHTLAVTSVSRREAQGGSCLPPLAALAATAAISRAVAGRPAAPGRLRACAVTGLCAAYGATAARPYAHAALNPSPQLTQRAVGAGIRALIPLQAALAARAGAVGTALPLAVLLPIARRLSRKVSPT
ncbi:SCO3242 family prenyltransferase [Streptomyces sp. DH37]|uniref:SCO3242 family prenyltransferase n=1 Tax=Streptomyces sp. DH37 TaxID=3040122 RepID=UPI00244152EA|nr:UbiA family prenyltransferase [Streptomyces sp. DH37]MDG9700737.1 UbiA family prenyltransferase [Streptomyces sp. DH37]